MIRQPRLVEEEEIEDTSEESEVIPVKYSITSYGADYPVDGLVKRLRREDVFIPPFQRGYVWNLEKASRFVESLLLGLPVPGIFLSKEEESQKLLVIDGQQRLKSLLYFYDGRFVDRSDFALVGVQKKFQGATYSTLSDDDRRRLDDSILHATVVRQDDPSDGNTSIYHIFERLNTGGIQLQPQEIRACIYYGEFNKVLKKLNENHDWRLIYGKVSPRMRDQELILRFLALYLSDESYQKPMKNYLNMYMYKNRHLTLHSEEQVRNAFVPTIAIARRTFGKKAFRPSRSLNAAVFDSVMIGLARRLSKGDVNDFDLLADCYTALLDDRDFIDLVTAATTDEESVRKRVEYTTKAFAEIP
jgi:hypothetical protein